MKSAGPMGLTRNVVVVGSANVDVSMRISALPGPGETVLAEGAAISLGGKGANQAAAAAACGAPTRLIARVGTDSFGRMIRDGMSERGVDINGIKEVAGASTGLAVIYVEPSGQNRIAVAPGANAQLQVDDLDEILPLMRNTAIVLLQCEIPMETVYRTIEMAAAAGCTVVLNPAPYRGLDLTRVASQITYLVANETEASQMTRSSIDSLTEAEHGASVLHRSGIECVIVTLGALGCVVADQHSVRRIAPHPVTPIDTTGAGDAFVGWLAGSLATGWSRDDAIRRANIYAALSTMQRGAQVPLLQQQELERVWGSISA